MLLGRKQTGKLLEIGCGKAGFLRMAEKHFQVEGVDISNHAIESIRPHFGERVMVGNLDSDPLPTNCYDVIVVFNILEHLHKPGEAIQKVAGAIRQDGVVIGSVPNNFGLVGGLVTRLGNFFDRTHIATFEPPVWRRFFEQAGFSQIEFFGEVQMGRNRCTYLRHRLWPYFSFNLMFICQSVSSQKVGESVVILAAEPPK